jgi:hypothetical protein
MNGNGEEIIKQVVLREDKVFRTELVIFRNGEIFIDEYFVGGLVTRMRFTRKNIKTFVDKLTDSIKDIIK